MLNILTMRKLLIIVMCAIFCSCNTEIEKSKKVIECDLKVNSFASIKNISVGTKEIIFLESKQEAFVKSIDKLLLSKHKIYVLDSKSKSVLLFDKKGRFVRKLFNVGKGPEEYIHIQDIIMNQKGHIMILDNRMHKILEYDSDLNFLREISFKGKIKAKAVHYFEQISEDYFAFYSNTDVNRLTIFDSADRKEIFTYKDDVVSYVKYLPVAHASSPFNRMNDKLIFYEKYKDSIFQIDENGVHELLKIKFKGYDFFDITKLKDSKDFRRNAEIIVNSGDILGIGDLYCTDRLLCIAVGVNNGRYVVYYDYQLNETFIHKLTDETRSMKPLGIDGNSIYSVLAPFNEKHREIINKYEPGIIDTLKFEDNYILEKSCIEILQ